MLEVLLPWQEKVLHKLRHAHELRPMHAQLWITPVAYGTAALIQNWLLGLMCHGTATVQPCGQCEDCRWVIAHTHPDIFWLSARESEDQIRIDAVRELCAFVDRTSARHGRRAVVVEQAHRLNEHAANALLKSLEEPGLETLFVLLTDRPVGVMPTIRSRCGVYHLPAPERSEVLDWLRGRFDRSDSQLIQAMAYGRSMPEQTELILEKNWLSQIEGLWTGMKQLAHKKTQPSVVVAGCKELWQESLLADVLMQWTEDLIRTNSQIDGSFLQHPELYPDYTQMTVRQSRAVEQIWGIWRSLVRVRDDLNGNIQPALCYERILSNFSALF